MLDISKDPRFKNELCNGDSVASYVKSYSTGLTQTLSEVDPSQLERALQVLEEVVSNHGTVYVCGNGGSAAIAEHLSCDWMKGTRGKNGRTLKVQCLNSNMALYSAISNDFGFANVFAMQIEMLARKNDLVVLISSSGNSANILNACSAAKKANATTISMTGFSGGELKNMTDISLHAPYNNYGLVEDCHQIIMHCLAQCLVKQIDD